MRIKGIIRADDGETRIIVTVIVDHRGACSAHEQRQIRKQALRGISDVLPDLRYTDFGIENTKVIKP